MISKKAIFLNDWFPCIIVNMQFVVGEAKEQLGMVAQKKNNYKL